MNQAMRSSGVPPPLFTTAASPADAGAGVASSVLTAAAGSTHYSSEKTTTINLKMLQSSRDIQTIVLIFKSLFRYPSYNS